MNGKRDPKIKDMSPGPGGYEPNMSVTKDALRGFQMSKSTRQIELASREALSQPGPGQYGSPDKLGYSGP